jgi:hypothetical protein
MSLFDNPMVKSATRAMTSEQKDKYKTVGEEMYNNIDFETGKILDNVKDSSDYIYVQIRSGLHPSHLDDNEKKIMFQTHGDKWYEKFGYVEEDLTKIVTLTPKLLDEQQ